MDISKSKRYVRDKLNISDIPGVKPDVYKWQRNFEGRSDYMNTDNIDGAKPAPLK